MRSKIPVEVTATLFGRARSKYQARAAQRGLPSEPTDGQLADFAFERLLEWLQDTESEAAHRAEVQKWRKENQPVEVVGVETDIPVITGASSISPRHGFRIASYGSCFKAVMSLAM